jgi:hypothetical protein
MRRTVAVLSLLAVAGCGALDRLQNDRMLVGGVVTTPAVALAGQGAATIAQVYFAQVATGSSPQGIGGAVVTLSYVPAGGGTGATYTLADQGGGNYGSTSVAYVEGATYTFRAVEGGNTYSGHVVAPPAPTIEHPQGTPLQPAQTVAYADIPDPYTIYRSGSDPAFYAVAEVDGVGSPTVTEKCTNAPSGTSAARYLQALLDPTPYEVASFDLSRTSCFPSSTATGYVVTLTGIRQAAGANGALSSNLNIESGVLAGATSAAALILQ